MAVAFPYVTAVYVPVAIFFDNLLPYAPRFLVQYVLVGLGSFAILFAAARFAYSHGAPRRLWVVGAVWVLISFIVSVGMLAASGERIPATEFALVYLDTAWMIILEALALGLASRLASPPNTTPTPPLTNATG